MPRVVAVSVSTPRIIDIRGQPTLTSIVRNPTPGAVHFGPGGPVGNRTAVHTEDVLATNSENYDYWTSALGVARSSWPHCYWGENLTLSGLDERSLRIGDRLSIGATAQLEVTSPRIPCFKLAWRLGQPDSFLRALVQSGRTGFYLRVLRAGPVMAGDEIRTESPHPSHLTVSDLSRLLHDDTAAVAQLERAQSMRGLGRQAIEMLRNRITQLTEGTRCRRGRWSGWRRFEICDIMVESSEVRSFKLRPADRGDVAQFRAGQFLTIRLPTRGGTPVTRVWSISDYDEDAGTYRLTIRRSANGRGSQYMHETARVGDTLEVRNPAGGFALDRSTVFRVTLISGGIGVTPMFAMLKAHAQRSNVSPLLWIHSTQNGATHVLRAEVAALLSSQPRFESRVIYTAPRSSDIQGVDFHEVGRLNAERITTMLGSSYQCRPFGRDIELPSQAGLFYICGPAQFEASVRGALRAFGVDEAAIFSERFHPSTNEVIASGPCEVRFTRSAKTVRWSPEEDASLLELAEEHGVEAPFNCRAGSCHSCETAISAGTVTYRLQPAVSPPPGRVLLCCSRPSSDSLELDL